MITVPDPAQVLHWLGGNLNVAVELDLGPGPELAGLWDEGEWDESLWSSNDPAWVDISAYVLSIDITSGAERWGERFQTGTASILVDNTLGYFTPDSTAVDPWFRDYRLGRLVRVVCMPDALDLLSVPGSVWETGLWDTATWGFTAPLGDIPDKVPLFTGRLDASMDGYAFGGFEITAVLQCVDFMGDWGASNPLAGTATGVQSTDARVEAALDKIAWDTSGRDIQVGDHNMETSDLAQTTLEELQRAADAEGGAFFADKDGTATFKNRTWLDTDTRSTVIQGYIGYDTVPDGAQAAHMVDVQVSWEMARVANQVQFARDGGTMQTAEDTVSQNKYGIRSYQRTDFHNSTDGEVLQLATDYLNASFESRLRIDSVTIVGVFDWDNQDLNRLIWFTEFGDRVAVKVAPPWGWEIERETHVMGISHSITASDWSVTLRLDDAQIIEFTYWILGDGEFGVLGETTRLM